MADNMLDRTGDSKGQYKLLEQTVWSPKEPICRFDRAASPASQIGREAARSRP